MSRKTIFLLLPVCGSIMLAGCAIDPEVHFARTHDALFASNWSAGEGVSEARDLRETPAVWWARWNDATLNALIEKTLENNTDIAQAQANLRAANAALTRETAGLFPSMDLSGNASRNRKNNEWTESYQGAGQAKWSFSFGGRDVAARAAAREDSQAKALSLADTQSAMTSEVAKTYVSLRLGQERLRIMENSVESYREARDLSQWRYQAGLVSATDAEQAQASYESARAQVASLKHTILGYQTALSRLTVLPLSTIQALPVTQIPTPPADIAVAIPAQVVAMRPDILAAQASVKAALYNVRVAQADFLPTLSLSGTIGTTAATVGALGASGTGIGALVGALSMPIFNWGDAIAGTETQKANVDKAQAQYTATLVTALEETENALSLIRTTRQKTHWLDVANQSSELAAKLALQQYSSGLEDYQTVLTTLRQWLNAQDAVVTNKAEWAAAHIDLYRALGGGWRPQEQN